MAFSIFNKTGPAGDKPAPPETARNAQPAKTEDGRNSGAGGSNAEMLAYDVEELSPLHEIAVLYAADHMDAAQALLKESVQSKTPHPQVWLMLLDIYKLRGFRKEFEDLAMIYTVKFERSPPTWNEQGSQPDLRKESRLASDFFCFQGKENLLVEVSKLVEFANRLGSVRIDVGKLKTVDSEGAMALANALAAFRKQELPARLNNVNQLLPVLKKTIGENPSRDYVGIWQLLFEFYQRQAMQNEFEDLGLEYAMSFEMSPPSWEAVPVPLAEGTESDVAGDALTSVNGFPLRGVLDLDHLTQIQQLFSHAAAHRELKVNMAGLLRIDFSAVGIFIDALSKFNAAGKKVVLIDINELIFPLLEAFGANRLALLLRRKVQ